MGEPVDSMVQTNLASPGCFLLLIPVSISLTAFGVFVGALVVGAVQALPNGDRVRLSFSACDDARASLEQRIDEIGLGAVVWTGPLDVEVTMPTERDVARGIPEVLARRGELAVHGGDATLVARGGIRAVTQSFSPTGDPVLGVVFTRDARLDVERWMVENPSEDLSVRIDGEVVLERSGRSVLLEDRLYVSSAARWERDRYRDIAEWYVTTLHPLPCDAQVRVTTLQVAD